MRISDKQEMRQMSWDNSKRKVDKLSGTNKVQVRMPFYQAILNMSSLSVGYNINKKHCRG